MHEIRYTYSTHKTLDKAESYLDSLFNAGLVSLSEYPKIEKLGKYWAVTLRDTALSAY